MNFNSLVEDIVLKLCAAWNNREFTVLEEDFLTEQVVIHSANILKVFPEAKEPLLKGRKEVINYWNELLKHNEFNMEIVEFLDNSRQAAAICRYPEINQTVKFELNLNQYGKVESMRVTDCTP